MKSIFGTLTVGMALLMGCAAPNNFTADEMSAKWKLITGDSFSDADVLASGVYLIKARVVGADKYGAPLADTDDVVAHSACGMPARCQFFKSGDNLAVAFFDGELGVWEVDMMLPVDSIEAVYTTREPFTSWLNDSFTIVTSDDGAGQVMVGFDSISELEWSEKLEPFLRKHLQFQPTDACAYLAPRLYKPNTDIPLWEKCRELWKWSREEIAENN